MRMKYTQNRVIYSCTSKSRTRSFVSSVPFLLPTAQTNFFSSHFTLHTTPPLPPLSSFTRSLIKSPVRKSQILTVPSSELVMTNQLLNWRHVTALWCLFGPARVCKHWPEVMSQILTVESAFPDTKVLFLSSMPLVRDWCPIKVWRHCPVSTCHTRIEVSREPLTMYTPSNCSE